MAMPLFIQSKADGYWDFFPQFGCFVFAIANKLLWIFLCMTPGAHVQELLRVDT